MPIDDFSADKPDAAPNAATTPGKYIKIAVPDFTDVASNTNPASMAPTPLTSYLRLGAVEDVAKAGKATGSVGLITDLQGNPLSPDPNAAFNPSYEPYAGFGGTNLPTDGRTPLPPATTPTGSSAYGKLPPGAAAWPAASGPDPSGEDLASLVQGFADDTRNRGAPRMRLPQSGVSPPTYTGGGQPMDTGTTAQGPLYGYPWVTPVMGAKAPGQLDAKNTSTTEDAVYSKSSKPTFFPDDYRTLESSQLHTKGGWRDHTDGNRITTTRGDKVEVIRGNYKLIVLGRQDQTKPKYAGMDLSGGQSDTGGGDLSADASADFNQGSTAFSNLFEWRQVATHQLYLDALAAGSTDPGLAALQAQAQADQNAVAAAQKALNDATVAAQALADPMGYLQATLVAAQQCVLLATTTAQATQAAAALAAAKKALQTAEQAVDTNLLEGTAMNALAITVPAGTSVTAASLVVAQTLAIQAAQAAWTATGVSDAVNLAKQADATNAASPNYTNAYQAYLTWTAVSTDVTTADKIASDTANAANLATAAAAAAAAAAQAQAASDAAAAAAAAAPTDAAVTKAATAAATAATAAQAQAAAAEQAAADAATSSKAEAAALSTSAIPTAVKNALSSWTTSWSTPPSWTSSITPPIAAMPVAYNVLNAAALAANLQTSPPPAPQAPDLTDALAQALTKAGASTSAAEAAAIAAGLYTTPLETLELWEDVDGAPGDYRSVSTAKKGSGPKVQVKFQAGGPSNMYAQTPGDGITFAQPISMGVSINETWSYQIYNYSGIGYYPTTAPQPWPPPPPKTQSQPIGTTPSSTAMTGAALPAVPPDPDAAATANWSPVPRWVIYPVGKIVNKSYVVEQSSETYVKQQVTVSAGPRPDADNPDPTSPLKTYSSDVPEWLSASGVPSTHYQDTLGATHTLPAKATYDRNLLTDPDTQFPDDDTLSGWIQDTSGSNNLPVRDYNMIDQTWTETHVKKQATFVRAGTTLSDTVVGSQNTKVKATNSTTNTTITAQQHTILNAGSTLTSTTVGSVESHSNVTTSYTTSTVSFSQAMNAAIATSTMSATIGTSAMSVVGLSFTLKAILTEITVTLGLVKLDFSNKLEVNMKNMETVVGLSSTEAQQVKNMLHGETITTKVAGTETKLALMHITT